MTGNRPSNLNKSLVTIGMPGLSQPTFTKIEGELCKWWASILTEEMKEAGIQGKKLAKGRKDFHEGVPAVSVVCYGGWSK